MTWIIELRYGSEKRSLPEKYNSEDAARAIAFDLLCDKLARSAHKFELWITEEESLSYRYGFGPFRDHARCRVIHKCSVSNAVVVIGPGGERHSTFAPPAVTMNDAGVIIEDAGGDSAFIPVLRAA